MSATRYYRSKIGRLPHAVRLELNERLRDGAVGAAVLDWLNASPEFAAVMAETGCGPLNAQNLTDWRSTGYADWLADQDKTARLRSLADLSLDIAAKTGGDPSAVGARILAGRMLEVLEAADLKDPKSTDALSKAITNLRGAENDAARTQLAAERHKLDAARLALDRQKFQRQTCELFMRWYDDRRARDIADDRTLESDAKTDALGRLMFGHLWEPAKA